jgi:hypothetical protein
VTSCAAGRRAPGYHPGLPVPAHRRHRIPRPLLNIHLSLTPIISLIAGILVLLMPKLLNYIVGFYLIAIGLIGILGIHQIRI